MGAEAEPGNWKQKGLALIGTGLGVLVVAGLGLYSFLTTMATPLYTDPQAVPSVTHATPLEKWADAVAQGRQLARAGLVEQNLPGLSVAVGAGGEIVWAEGFGWADLEKGVPLAPSMGFRIGHASKPVTSAAVGLLLEKDRLRLDDEIQTYVPAFPRKQWPVTLRQLMGHVAGVRHYRDEGDYMPTAHCERASEGLQPFANDPLRFEPETEYGYSTFGWILVSAAVEAAAEQPFSTFMRTEIFKPLGMTDTTFDSAIAPVADRVTFYYQRFNGDPRHGEELENKIDYSCFAGAGAILSTPSDLVRFGNAIGSGRLLQPDTVTKLQTPQLLASGEWTDYGLGWMLETAQLGGAPTRMAGHASRTLLGGSTSFLTFPQRGIVVAVTTNISGKDTKSIALGIAQAFAERRASDASSSNLNALSQHAAHAQVSIPVTNAVGGTPRARPSRQSPEIRSASSGTIRTRIGPTSGSW
jgi:serine beta-lactamase-like protein LACTB, mitochondrial